MKNLCITLVIIQFRFLNMYKINLQGCFPICVLCVCSTVNEAELLKTEYYVGDKFLESLSRNKIV
jgi:hypothetical protein